MLGQIFLAVLLSSGAYAAPVPQLPDLSALLGSLGLGGSGAAGLLGSLGGGAAGGFDPLAALGSLASLLPTPKPATDSNGAAFAAWLRNASGPDLRFLGDIFRVPNLEKYIDSYLDWRNVSQVPFIGPLKFGPAPTGCNKYEIIIGEIYLRNGSP
jgi:hypothetical protein